MLGNREGSYATWIPKNINNTNTYSSDGGFNAFRESTFGVAGLNILNDTHAKYTWHRHTCDDRVNTAAVNLGPSNNYGFNTTVTCVTRGDNGGFAMVATDEVYIVRQPASICPHHWGQTKSGHSASKKALRGEEQVLAVAEAAPSLASFEFTHASVKGAKVGAEYVRPAAAGPSLPAPKSKHTLLDTGACSASEQVHISLGNADDSVVVSYVSNMIKGEVYFSAKKEDLTKTTPKPKYQTVSGGVGTSGSQGRFFNPATIYPHLGANTSNIEFWANMADTTAWAVDPVNGMHWNMYKAVKGVNESDTFAKLMAAYYPAYLNPNGGSTASPILGYTNPYGYYDSSIFHTVTLSGLTAGMTYYYRVAGSCKVYSFKVPKCDYPFTIGLLSDVGSTAISQLSVQSVAALKPDLALLAGNIAMADGYPEIWDSVGNMMEPVFAKIPLLTAAGNHEFLYNENFAQYFGRYPTPYQASKSTSPLYYAKVNLAIGNSWKS